MKIAIIGAGFAGLSAAYSLSKAGNDVTVFESLAGPGGLATGFKEKNWQWSLEHHYHHLFTSDHSIIDLANEIGHPINFKRPKTSTYYNHQIAQLDSPLSLLSFPSLTIINKVRTAVGLVILRLNPFWKPFEKFTAKKFINAIMGAQSWKVLWEPLFVGKFGKYSDQISASWFWSRIYKRSSTLGYPEGGFLSLAHSLEIACTDFKTTFNYNTRINSIKLLSNNLLEVSFGTAKKTFDKIICTLPVFQLNKICPGSVQSQKTLDSLGAVNLVLSLKKAFLSDNIYWLNINDRKMPFLAVVEHTNFISKKHYGGTNLLYIGNYLEANHAYFSYSASDLLKIFIPFLKQINPDFSPKSVKSAWVFKAPFAQPITTLNFSKYIPKIKTSIPNLYLANMQQVYPWDRGTNYAVELGEKVANICVTT